MSPRFMIVLLAASLLLAGHSTDATFCQYCTRAISRIQEIFNGNKQIPKLMCNIYQGEERADCEQDMGSFGRNVSLADPRKVCVYMHLCSPTKSKLLVEDE